MSRQSVPPSHPKRRQRGLPLIGTYLLEVGEQTVWQVRNLDRASRQAQLVSADMRSTIRWVAAHDLDRDYRVAGA